jgi:hypothetical protein
VTTDYRRVLAEASYKHLGARDVAMTFPGSGIHPDNFLRIL